MKCKHLSASSIKCFKMCQFKFFCEYELRETMKQTYAADLGSFIHTIFEKIARRDMAATEWQDFANERFRGMLPVAATHRDYKKLGVKELTNCIWNDVNYLVGLVFSRKPSDNPLETGNIIDAEKSFRIDIGGGVIIKGFIDLVLSHDDGKTVEIYDWKTGRWTLSAAEAANDPQVLMYSLAGRILYPRSKNFVTLDYIRSEPVRVTPDDATIEATKRALRHYWFKIRSTDRPERFNTASSVCRNLCSRTRCNQLWKEHAA